MHQRKLSVKNFKSGTRLSMSTQETLALVMTRSGGSSNLPNTLMSISLRYHLPLTLKKLRNVQKKTRKCGLANRHLVQKSTSAGCKFVFGLKGNIPNRYYLPGQGDAHQRSREGIVGSRCGCVLPTKRMGRHQFLC